ncbi:MAG: hypothetical protein M1305_03095 [Candidatus Marsarchaeota archaeon]|nr:hypothetical protein [Candidatus Marsarchaeota archaeon]
MQQGPLGEGSKPPLKKKARENALTIVMIGALLFLGLYGLYVLVDTTWPAPTQHGSASAIACAKDLVSENLKAPATAKWQEETVVEKSGDKYLVFVVVDAQNSFGAMMRTRYLVYLRLLDNDQYKYIPSTPFIECSDPPTEDEISVMKGMAGWNAASNESQ